VRHAVTKGHGPPNPGVFVLTSMRFTATSCPPDFHCSSLPLFHFRDLPFSLRAPSLRRERPSSPAPAFFSNTFARP